MKLVQAIRLEDEEIEQVQGAMRWIGLHPQANEESTKARYAKRGEDVRRELQGMLMQVTQGNEPLFRSKLAQVLSALGEIRAQAWTEAHEDYWTTRGTGPLYAQPLVEARALAIADIQGAITVIERALSILPPDEPEEDDYDRV